MHGSKPELLLRKHEHAISTAHKKRMLEIKMYLAFELSDVVFNAMLS